jgi:hypothetical protein
VVVSAHASPSDRKPALRSAITASVFNMSRVDRASRSTRHHQHVVGVELRPTGAVCYFAARLSKPSLLQSSLPTP